MAWVPVAMAVVGGINAYQQNKAKEQSAEYNAQVNEVNKGFALRDQATAATRARGRATAAYGASGVQLGTGSPLDVLADAAGQAELDRMKITYNYDSRTSLLKQEASNYRSSALFDVAAGGMRGYASAIPMFGASSGAASGAVNTGTVTGSDMDIFTSYG